MQEEGAYAGLLLYLIINAKVNEVIFSNHSVCQCTCCCITKKNVHVAVLEDMDSITFHPYNETETNGQKEGN